jgi:hypothetical protein
MEVFSGFAIGEFKKKAGSSGQTLEMSGPAL